MAVNVNVNVFHLQSRDDGYYIKKRLFNSFLKYLVLARRIFLLFFVVNVLFQSLLSFLRELVSHVTDNPFTAEFFYIVV